MTSNSAEALRRIHENKRTQSKILDLSGLGLRELPDELWDCVWLEELGLGHQYGWNDEKQEWTQDSSDGKMANRLTTLPNTFSNFTNLNRLLLDYNPLKDISGLSDLVSLKNLNLSGNQISDISALSNLVNLTNLELQNTPLSDISPLSNLLNLTELNLQEAPVSDIWVLSNLVNLTKLVLWDTAINDISALSNLVNLVELDLWNTSIRDINALSKLKKLTKLYINSPYIEYLNTIGELVNLTRLWIGDSKIKDISVLGDLPKLTELNLWSIGISDISVLSSLPRLTNLSLSSNQISDISVLSSLPGLTNLYLNSIRIRDISVLSSLPGLTDLSLSSNQISDISVLSSLPGLTNLSLNSAQIRDISVLSSLPKLTNLNLSSAQISDISVLSSLPGLTDLSLSSNQISDISVLSSLPGLTDLYLSSAQISDISVLSSLPGLTNLNLRETQISDISVLSSLPKLTNLNLSSAQISDISVLSSLPKLTNLNLWETQISDISVLSSLPGLTDLSLSSAQISDISVLSSLSGLTDLYLSSAQISDISVLSSLPGLTNLNLQETQISDISVLSSLPKLTNLNFSGTQISEISLLGSLVNLTELDLSSSALPYFPFALLSLPKLKNLNLQNTHCLNLPPELTHEYNALPDLRNYYAELQKNAYTAYDAKLLTVGNGRVGKTSVLKALFQLDTFNPLEDSTHGIQLFATTLPLPQKPEPANLKLWDFGGQELYHATHRIFMKSRALYLLVWDPHTEQNPGEDPITIDGQTYIFRNHPLSYWLGNIRALSPHAKIIVVCNKSDDGQERFPDQLSALQEKYKIDSFISVSARTGYGLNTLRQRVAYVLDNMPEIGMPMPVSWKQVQDQLAAITDQPFITMEQYQRICSAEGLSAGSAITVLRFLHHSGFLFWHEQHLRDQIILDQKWALDAIYQLLDRNSWYKLLKGNGLRKRSDLALCWKEYTPTQVQVFLEMMQSCELALEIGDDKEKDRTYLIPEFLPDHPATAVAYTWDAATSPVFHFRFQHHFFHAALIQRFIARSAKLAESYDLLWRTGLLLKVEGTMARIQVFPEEGRIEMQVRGTNPAELIERLKNEIAGIQETEGDSGFLLSLSGQEEEWVTLEQIQPHLNKGKSQIASTTGEILELAPFRHLIHTPSQEEEEDEAPPMDLKSLADQQSGAQLLQRITALSLTDIKSIAKRKIIDGLEIAIAYLLEHLHPTSILLDDLIQLEGQWSSFKRRERIGILSHDNTQLTENQIRDGILSFINALKESDIKP